MDFEDLPEELISPPEKRLIHTYISGKPDKNSLVVTVMALLFVVFISQVYWMNLFSIAEYLPAVNRKIFEQDQWWRLFTATLIHADMGHLLSNLYMLGIFSFFVYGYFGFTVYPLLSFFAAGIVNALSIHTYPPDVRLLGASGLVYLLGGFWLTMYLFIQRQYTYTHRLVRVLGIALLVFFPTSFKPTTSYRAHFIGFTVGVAFALFYFLTHRHQIRKKETYKQIH